MTEPEDNRAELERHYGRVYSTEELRASFDVLQFAAPLVVVQRKSDLALGSLRFQAWPRYYFDWRNKEGQP